MTDRLRIEHGPDRVVATLDRPEARNAIDAEIVAELHRLCDSLERAPRGQGSLVASVVTADGDFAAALVTDAGCYHGRFLILDSDCAAESTGHGTPMPQLVHGGPGRAGNGEEEAGLRAVHHHMQRTALQGSPALLERIATS